MAQRGTEFGKSGDAQATPAGDQPVIPEQRAASEPSPAPVRRGSVLGYLAEVEPLMEPTGGYPMVVRRQPPGASAPAAPAPPPSVPPRTGSTVENEPAAPARRRRIWPLIVVLVVVIVALAVLLLAVARRQSTGAVSLPPPSGVAAAPAANPSATPAEQPRVDSSDATQPSLGDTTGSAPADQASASASASPSPTPAAAPPALTARYETARNTGVLGLTGYRGRITVGNPGNLSVGGWTVTLVLPDSQRVATASGAEYRQDGTTVTFTPSTDTLTVPATGSVSFTFDVDALLGGPPLACAIDEHPCD